MILMVAGVDKQHMWAKSILFFVVTIGEGEVIVAHILRSKFVVRNKREEFVRMNSAIVEQPFGMTLIAAHTLKPTYAYIDFLISKTLNRGH